jgi:hypothetical protein
MSASKAQVGEARVIEVKSFSMPSRTITRGPSDTLLAGAAPPAHPQALDRA